MPTPTILVTTKNSLLAGMNPNSPIGQSADAALSGTNTGTLTYGGGTYAAFDGPAEKPAALSAYVPVSGSSFSNWVGKNWAVLPVNLPSDAEPDALLYVAKSFEATSPSDAPFSTAGAVTWVFQGSSNAVTWTTLATGTTTGDDGEVVSQDGLGGGAYQFHRFAIEGDSVSIAGVDTAAIAVAKLDINTDRGIHQGTIVIPPVPALVPAPPFPLSLFTGVVNGGYWVASTPGNTVSQILDTSGLGNHGTQTDATQQLVLTTGLNGVACYEPSATTSGADDGFDLPAISVNQQSFGLWCIYRTRSMPDDAARSIANFGPTAANFVVDSEIKRLRVVTGGAVIQYGPNGRSDLVIEILTGGVSSARMRINGSQVTLSALTAASVTGGTIFCRQDGFMIFGEAYEFGLIDRELTTNEITLLETYAQSVLQRTWPTYGQVTIDGDSLTVGAFTAGSWTLLLDDDTGDQFIQISQARPGQTVQTNATDAAGTAALFGTGLTKKIAVLCGGTNDIGVSGRTAAQVLADMQTWATTLHNAGIRTIICTIVDRDDAGWSIPKEAIRLVVNAGILGLSNVDAVVDLAALSVFSNPLDTTYYNADKLHWKDTTHTPVKNAVKAAVLSL